MESFTSTPANHVLDAGLGYLTQNFSWNAEDGRFPLTLHSEVFQNEWLGPLNNSAHYEYDGEIVISVLSIPQLSVIVHCKCKQGHATHNLSIRLENASGIVLTWPGVTRLFARIRIMEATTAEQLKYMVVDDIESGHSKSDVEHPDTNQTFRPWSDEEDSETDTA